MLKFWLNERDLNVTQSYRYALCRDTNLYDFHALCRDDMPYDFLVGTPTICCYFTVIQSSLNIETILI